MRLTRGIRSELLNGKYRDVLISDFTDAGFTEAFKRYFGELGISVEDWDGLFAEMNGTEGNRAYVRYDENGEAVGFIQFVAIELENWFFCERLGFIREFWISGEYRKMGHGSELLGLAERYFSDNGIRKVILTTDTAPEFYEAKGYKRDGSFTAKNKDDVFVKELL